MNTPKVMLIEDDTKLALLLKDYFQQNGIDLQHVDSDHQVFDTILQQQPDVLLLDLMLPVNDGLFICRQIRQKFKGKILMFTASGDDIDQVAAIELGVDDFVQKPVQPRVLLARIKMLLRRDSAGADSAPATRDNSEHKFGRLWVNSAMQRCMLDETLVELTPSEFALLWELVSNAYEPVSRDRLTLVVTGNEFDGMNRAVDNKVVQLRKKLADNPTRPKGIITVRNKGYMLVPEYWQEN